VLRSPRAQGVGFQLGPWLRLEAELRISLELLLIEILEVVRAPESRAEAKGVLGFHPILVQKLHACALDGCSLEAPNDPSRISQEPLTPGLNISLCLSLISQCSMCYPSDSMCAVR
jgi:hypothetical protein